MRAREIPATILLFGLVAGCDLGLCTNTCASRRDGVCDDMGECAFGTDCDDCGMRFGGGGTGGAPDYDSPVGDVYARAGGGGLHRRRLLHR
jgi:hypothetical protein